MKHSRISRGAAATRRVRHGATASDRFFATALADIDEHLAGSASGTLNALKQIANAAGAGIVERQRHQDRLRQGRGIPTRAVAG